MTGQPKELTFYVTDKCLPGTIPPGYRIERTDASTVWLTFRSDPRGWVTVNRLRLRTRLRIAVGSVLAWVIGL